MGTPIQVNFNGRKRGAIGLSYAVSTALVLPNHMTDAGASKEEQDEWVQITLYELGYEHISNLRWCIAVPVGK